MLAADGGLHGGPGSQDWEAVLRLVAAERVAGLDVERQMTDEMLAQVAGLTHVTRLRLGGSAALTDDGLRQLARMPQLRELDLSGCQVTDRGLAVLRELPALEKISLSWTAVTDAGVAHLAGCEQLVNVDLAMTATGDGALRALAGKERLRHLRTGNRVSDAGLPLLHQFPIFQTWRGGEPALALLSPEAEPNSLMLRGTLTDRGMAALAGLDGLFALNVHDARLGLTSGALAPLAGLAHLGFLAFDATDEAMPYVAALPNLRFLMCQDTAAGDDGFAALSRSRSIEYIWGRRCRNLRRRGFQAMANMPALRALAVSLDDVGDAGASAAELPGAARADADGAARRAVPPRGALRGARVARSDVLSRHDRPGHGADRPPAATRELLRELHQDHRSHAGAARRHGVAGAGWSSPAAPG